MNPKCNFCRPEYCDEFFHNVYPKSQNSILHKTKNFFITIDGFPVCENHLLIVPFDHKLSFSNLSKELSQEFEEVLNYIKKYIIIVVIMFYLNMEIIEKTIMIKELLEILLIMLICIFFLIKMYQKRN